MPETCVGFSGSSLAVKAGPLFIDPQNPLSVTTGPLPTILPDKGGTWFCGSIVKGPPTKATALRSKLILVPELTSQTPEDQYA